MANIVSVANITSIPSYPQWVENPVPEQEAMNLIREPLEFEITYARELMNI